MKAAIKIVFILITIFCVSACQEEEIKSQIAIEEIQDCVDCPVMVLIPKGNFMMGALPYDKQADKYEKPRHPVEIKHDFYMGKYEVTYGQYMACVRDGGCRFTPPDMLAECHKRLGCSAMHRKEPVDINKLPVVGVSYNDAQEYVTWLRGKTGQKYRLPTEEEWEYAARAGTETIFWWGDDMEDGRTMCASCDIRNPMQKLPMHVGSYPPNPFGLHDMLGNAREVTRSCFPEMYDIESDQKNKEECKISIVRGGGWYSATLRIRASDRGKIQLVKRINNVGFRIANTVTVNRKGDKE